MSKFVEKVSLATPKNKPIDLSHKIYTSFDFMQNRVVMCEEMLPSDSFDVTLNNYISAAPMASRVYGDIRVKTMAFFVPNRILWKDWQNFLTGGETGSAVFTPPRVGLYALYTKFYQLYVFKEDETLTETERAMYAYQFHNYRNFLSEMGVPVNNLYDEINDTWIAPVNQQELISELPFRAVRWVWFDWLRDQNVISEALRSSYLDDSGNSHFENGVGMTYEDYYHPMPISWKKDFFTTLFKDPQRGTMSSIASDLVVTSENLNGKPGAANAQVIWDVSSTSGSASSVGQKIGVNPTGNTASTTPGTYKKVGTDFSILAFRLANATQKFLEKNNIAGSNALQQLLAHWGTAPNPAVFNRTQYIGSHEFSLNIDEVTSTNGDANGNQGEVVTKLNGGNSNANFKFTANEHGYFVVIQTCRPETGYYQGLAKSLQRFDRFDYFTPEMEATGYDVVLGKELYFRDGASTDKSINNKVAGYKPRYGDYKFHNNKVCGDLARNIMASYHLCRDLQPLSDLWSEDGLPIMAADTWFTMATDGEIPADANGGFDRIFKDTNFDFDHFIQVINVKFIAHRPMEAYTTPAIADIRGNDTTLPYAGVRL